MFLEKIKLIAETRIIENAAIELITIMYLDFIDALENSVFRLIIITSRELFNLYDLQKKSILIF